MQARSGELRSQYTIPYQKQAHVQTRFRLANDHQILMTFRTELVRFVHLSHMPAADGFCYHSHNSSCSAWQSKTCSVCEDNVPRLWLSLYALKTIVSAVSRASLQIGTAITSMDGMVKLPDCSGVAQGLHVPNPPSHFGAQALLFYTSHPAQTDSHPILFMQISMIEWRHLQIQSMCYHCTAI